MSLDFQIKNDSVKVAIGISEWEPDSIFIALKDYKHEVQLSEREARRLVEALLEKLDELENGVKEDGSE